MDTTREYLESKLEPWHGVDCSERVEEWIHGAIDYLKRNPTERDTCALSGDTRVDVRRTGFDPDSRFEVMVSKIQRQGYVSENARVSPVERWD